MILSKTSKSSYAAIPEIKKKAFRYEGPTSCGVMESVVTVTCWKECPCEYRQGNWGHAESLVVSWESFFSAVVTPLLIRLLLRFQLCRRCWSQSGGATVPREPLRTLRGALCCTWDLTADTAIPCFSSPCLRFQCNCFAVMLFHLGSWWFCFHPHQLRAYFRYSSNPCAAAYFFYFCSFVFIENIWGAKKVVTLQFPVLFKLFS